MLDMLMGICAMLPAGRTGGVLAARRCAGTRTPASRGNTRNGVSAVGAPLRRRPFAVRVVSEIGLDIVLGAHEPRLHRGHVRVPADLHEPRCAVALLRNERRTAL